MALNQINRLLWIVDTIHRYRRITFEELNVLWKEKEELSGGEEMLKRSFHKWKISIMDTFGLLVECEKTAPYRYYIANAEDLECGSIENWLISTFSVSNSLMESRSIKDRILLEDVPSGKEYLEPILDAIKKNRFVHIKYYNYRKGETLCHYVGPLCVKLFHQRWYLVGRRWPANDDLVFCLDRIKDFRLSSHTFEYPADFQPEEFFKGCIGVIVGDGSAQEIVKLKVNPGQANYLRDLPLHESQQETERTEEYCIFVYKLRPTYDFKQELLGMGENIEVLEPRWLRSEIAERARRILERDVDVPEEKVR